MILTLIQKISSFRQSLIHSAIEKRNLNCYKLVCRDVLDQIEKDVANASAMLVPISEYSTVKPQDIESAKYLLKLAKISLDVIRQA